jgi:hypothetical protein
MNCKATNCRAAVCVACRGCALHDYIWALKKDILAVCQSMTVARRIVSGSAGTALKAAQDQLFNAINRAQMVRVK